jgi:hypothetical protein
MEIVNDNSLNKSKLIPTCDILMNINTGDFVMISYARKSESGFTAMCGPVQNISKKEMKSNGLYLIQNDIAGFRKRINCEKSEFECMPLIKQNKFYREHKLVGIAEYENDKLMLSPMHNNRGRHTSKPGEELFVTLPCTSDEFFDKLKMAFAKC